jgi:hypothetical protein
MYLWAGDDCADNKLPKEEYFIDSTTLLTCQKYYGMAEYLFPSLKDHIYNSSAVYEEQHVYILIKIFINMYIKIRLKNLAKKKMTEEIQGANVRRELTKLNLFNHQ